MRIKNWPNCLQKRELSDTHLKCFYNLIGAIVKQAITDYLKFRLYEKGRVKYHGKSFLRTIEIYGRDAGNFLFEKSHLEDFFKRFQAEKAINSFYIRERVKALYRSLSQKPTADIRRYLKKDLKVF